MSLPKDYAEQVCSLSRSLEIIGERWTLLIIRDAFYGVRRFSDFRDHLGIPRAVLAERLGLLVEHGILERSPAPGGREQYALTAKGAGLWPPPRAPLTWGNEHYVPEPRRRAFTHAGCGGAVDGDGRCAACRTRPAPGDLTVQPRAQAAAAARRADAVSRALAFPHRLLVPIGPAPSGPA